MSKQIRLKKRKIKITECDNNKGDCFFWNGRQSLDEIGRAHLKGPPKKCELQKIYSREESNIYFKTCPLEDYINE